MTILLPSSNPDIMLESFSRYSAAPIFFITYLIVSVYFIANIVSCSKIQLYIICNDNHGMMIIIVFVAHIDIVHFARGIWE